jgi:hypothetical protein
MYVYSNGNIKGRKVALYDYWPHFSPQPPHTPKLNNESVLAEIMYVVIGIVAWELSLQITRHLSSINRKL